MKLEITSSTRQGLREYQEDRIIVIPNINGRFTLCAVFDGHVGDMASEFAKNNVGNIFKKQLQKYKDMYKVLFQTVYELEYQYRDFFNDKKISIPEISGTTAVICVISHNDSILYIANVGDSRAIMTRGNRVYQLTADHNINTVEKDRLKLMKKHKSGYINDGYLWTEYVIEIPCPDMECPYNVDKNYALNVTRTIGDPLFKKDYNYFLVRASVKDKIDYDLIPWIPDIFSYKLTGGDIIVMATDGVFNFLSNVEIAKIVKKKNAEDVTQMALNNGSTDNVSSIVIKVQT